MDSGSVGSFPAVRAAQVRQSYWAHLRIIKFSFAALVDSPA